jgi:hypothetical protein
MPLFNISDAVQAVLQDLNVGFDGIFKGVEDPKPAGVFADVEVGADGVSVLAWEWKVRHVGSLQGTPATGKTLTIRGTTVIDASDGGEPTFARYIDWLALYAQIGAVTIARPPVRSRARIRGNVQFPEPPPAP